MLWNGILFGLLFLIASFIGAIVVAYYVKLRCDPLRSGLAIHSNEANCKRFISSQFLVFFSYYQLLPVFVKEIFVGNIGFTGVFLSTLCSAVLRYKRENVDPDSWEYNFSSSTLSSNLSGCAANIWEDLLKPRYETRMTQRRILQLNKGLGIC